MSVREFLAAGKYVNAVPYTIETVPVDEENMTVRQAREHVEAEKLRQRDQKRKCREGESAMNALLRSDLESEHGITGSQKAEKLWEIAWELGHSSGYSEIISHYETMVDLVK